MVDEETISDCLSELINHFPLDSVNWSAGTYDQYLFDLQKTVNDNYETGNFQVSYFYSHIIFMCYVYYCVEQTYLLRPERMNDVYYPINAYSGRDDKPDIQDYSSVYDFSKIPEKEIFKIFHIMGMSHEKIKALSKYISQRDGFAHATGQGNISEDKLESNLRTIKGNMNTLHKVFQSNVFDKYIKLLLSKYVFAFDDLQDEFEEWIFDERFSIVDLEYICKSGISKVRDSNEKFRHNYHDIKLIHCAFIEYCIENYNINQPCNYENLRDFSYLKYKYHENAQGYIENELGISGYVCATQGGEFPQYDCPECGMDQLVFDNEHGKYICFHCGSEFQQEDLKECSRCGIKILSSEDTLCINCNEDYINE